ncbi:LysR family transcriptional regulator [Kerstersia sp.]|uniref:LysR family transcriptional regulator n=1 Tax=Kerstersia sp. TaxID=1930783 RepID=UPI003F8DB9F8
MKESLVTLSAAPERDTLVEIKLLQLFDCLYETRSVTRTADQLGQSQPTISIWLGKLRQQLGDPLFVRGADGMQPTPRADALIGPARDILESLRRLPSVAPSFSPHHTERLFRLCITDASHITLLPALLPRLREAAPHARLEALRIDGNTAQVLQSGQADVALGYIPWLQSGIYQQALFPQDWICLAHPSHPRLGETLTRADYERESHIGVVAGTGFQLLDAAITSQHIQRRIALELPAFPGLAPIVASTDLLATLPRHIGETLAQTHGLRTFPCPFPIPTFTVKQHWHARFHSDAGNRWLRQLIASIFQKNA